MSDRERFLSLLSSSFPALSSGRLEALWGHYVLLDRWNKKLNLTSIRDMDEAVLRHYGESLFLGGLLPEEAISVVDVGAGGGFPGIPVAVIRPQAQLTLVEAHQRKAVFLREATRGWANVRVEARRAEQVQWKFDWLVSRAVSWEDLKAVSKGRGRLQVGLLTSEGESTAILGEPGWRWREPVKLPWGKQRVALLGECFT